jgi:hypothetical protein
MARHCTDLARIAWALALAFSGVARAEGAAADDARIYLFTPSSPKKPRVLTHLPTPQQVSDAPILIVRRKAGVDPVRLGRSRTVLEIEERAVILDAGEHD